jgi:hypothetical protein
LPIPIYDDLLFGYAADDAVLGSYLVVVMRDYATRCVTRRRLH